MTKALISIIAFIFSFNFSYAEYDGWFVKFEIKTNKNDTIIGHIYLAQAYFNKDSANNTNYLLRHFDKEEGSYLNDTLTFCKKRIRYKVVNQHDSEVGYDYTITQIDHIPFNHIKSIKIVEMIDYSYLNSLNFLTNYNNLDWINAPVEKVLDFGGYYCSYVLRIHENSEKIDTVHELYLEYIETYKKEKKSLEESNGNYSLEQSEEIDKLNVLLDKKVDSLIEMLKGEKIAVQSFCSC